MLELFSGINLKHAQLCQILSTLTRVELMSSINRKKGRNVNDSIFSLLIFEEGFDYFHFKESSSIGGARA